jgi:hypothetical protein
MLFCIGWVGTEGYCTISTLEARSPSFLQAVVSLFPAPRGRFLCLALTHKIILISSFPYLQGVAKETLQDNTFINLAVFVYPSARVSLLTGFLLNLILEV